MVVQFNIHTHFAGKENQILSLQENQYTDLHVFSFGHHPVELPNHWDEEAFVNRLQHKNCVAIGECGLDKRSPFDFETQHFFFKKQLELSEKHQFPVILHCVRAWNEIAKLKEELKPKQPWIYHGFNKANLVPELLKHGVHFSLGHHILQSESLQEAIHGIPLDQLFLETDYQTKVEISEIYQKVCEIKGISLRELENQIEINVKTTFKKWHIG